MAPSSLHVYHVKLEKYSVLLCTMKTLLETLLWKLLAMIPTIDDSATLISCNEVEKQGFLSSNPCLSLDSMLQRRTAIFYCVAEGCLVLCLRNCILDKLFSTSLTFPCCNLNFTLTFYRHHGKEAYLNYGCFSRMTTLLHPQNVSKNN